MIAFASASFISTVFSDYNPDSEWKPYIWTGSLLSAGIVGYLRYESGMHFPTDILVGAAVGSILGYAIPWMHRERKDCLSFNSRVYGENYELSVHINF
jgi:membrane-associated phospholipid phosphatase